MKIIYVSGAMADVDFNDYVRKAHLPINPSNQNFHYRFIKALSISGDVKAITLRPFASKMFDYETINGQNATDGNIAFEYLPDNSSRLYRLLKRNSSISKKLTLEIGKNKEDVVLLVDSLKYSLSKVAIKVAKRNKVKIFGIITDNPRLFSNESKAYARAVLSLANKYDGFIALSHDLNKLFNRKNKPAYVFSGFAEEYPFLTMEDHKPYFFACGALYERYGIKNLVEAFSKTKIKRNLLIAGHGPLISFIKEYSYKDSRIQYVGLLSKSDIAKYEQNADLNINPRLFDEQLDKYSVPSKVLEYLSSGTPLLSTMHTVLHEQFCGEVIWIKDGTSDEIRKALELFIQIQTDDMKKKALLAKKKVLDEYSLSVQGKKIYEFLVSNNSFSTIKATRRNSKLS